MDMNKMYYITTRSTDPYFNLAMEQYVFDHLGKGTDCFMLWQNVNSIIIGKYQNAHAEINAEYVREHGITVARRLSGGGAVYHDLGNLNFTFIADEQGDHFDFSTYCKAIISVLSKMGVHAQLSGRNDLTVDGKKFSGNSQYFKRGRVMHHGTILFDSDLTVLSQALNVKPDKYEAKGVKSVRSRVTNLKPYLSEFSCISDFWSALRDEVISEYKAVPYELPEEALAQIKQMRANMYSRWEWNYGASPAYNVSKERYLEGCGTVQVYIDVGEAGVINDIQFFGDFFASREPEELSKLLKGCTMDEKALYTRLAGTDIDLFFKNLTAKKLIRLITE